MYTGFQSMTWHKFGLLLATLGASGLSACAHAGTGTPPIAFEWQRKDHASCGSISGVMPDGRTFAGTYHEVKDGTWLAGPADPMGYRYNVRVYATLTTTDGTSLRCSFDLRQPALGLAGGGEGICRPSDDTGRFGAVLNEPGVSDATQSQFQAS